MEEYNDTSDIIKLLVAANELCLGELITYIQSFLIENKENWMEQNFGLIYQTSFKKNVFMELQKYCNDLISKEPDKIFKSLNYSSTSENLLVSLIQNDNLQISELQVWEHVLKWGLAKNPELPSDPTNFSKEEFNTLKNSLQQCIPFIKFYNLTSEGFSDKVLPYKKILPKELYKDLLKTYLRLSDPDKRPIDKVNLGTSFSETNATITEVTMTSPNPCNPIGQRIFQKLGQEVNQAASYNRGGRKIRKIRSGLIPERGAPGI